MFFYQRTACIEFLDHTKVRVTTPFRQSIFDLEKMEKEDRLFIDLIDLKTGTNSKNMKFCAFVDDIDDPELERRYVLNVMAHRDEIDSVEFSDEFKVVKVKILDD